MIRFLSFCFCFCFLFLFCVGEASADVKVYFAPKSTVYETDTSAEIRKYLESFGKGGVKYENDNPKAVIEAMIKYQNKIQKKVSGFFNGNDMIKYDGAVCKISITTGNTAPSDPILTQVFALEQLADNGLKPCRELNNKLVSVIDKDDNFKYPAVVKNYGLLSMDMIFYFNNN